MWGGWKVKVVLVYCLLFVVMGIVVVRGLCVGVSSSWVSVFCCVGVLWDVFRDFGFCELFS